MNTIEIICDGGCRNNQTPEKREAYGSFIITATPILIPPPPVIHKRFYGNKTNNEAEYMALIDALEFVKSLYNGKLVEKLVIKTDSQLLIGHLSQGWRIKQPHLYELYAKVKHLLVDVAIFPITGVVFEKINEKDMKQIIGH